MKFPYKKIKNLFIRKFYLTAVKKNETKIIKKQILT